MYNFRSRVGIRSNVVLDPGEEGTELVEVNQSALVLVQLFKQPPSIFFVILHLRAVNAIGRPLGALSG